MIYAPAIHGHYRRVGAAIRAAATDPSAVTTVACMLGEHRRGLLADDDVCVPEFPFPEEAALALGRVARLRGLAVAAGRRRSPSWPTTDRRAAQALVAGWLDG